MIVIRNKSPPVRFTYSNSQVALKRSMSQSDKSDRFSTKKYKEKHLAFIKETLDGKLEEIKRENTMSIYTDYKEPTKPKILNRKKSLRESNILEISLEKIVKK